MNDMEYKMLKPDGSLSEFVESFWMLINHSDKKKDIVIVPDGRIDVSYSATKPYHVALLGLETEPSSASIPAKSSIFAISFKLMAIEYIFDGKFSSLLNSAYQLPLGYLGITQKDLKNFDDFCTQAGNYLKQCLPTTVDQRKQKLFQLIYESHGSIPVAELAESVSWNSRQINRYFNNSFGLSLKAYCNILRFRASFQQIKEGKLFPEQHFTDQAHFIKDVKKYSGVTPKELSKNSQDRFIQITVIPPKKS